MTTLLIGCIFWILFVVLVNCATNKEKFFDLLLSILVICGMILATVGVYYTGELIRYLCNK